MNVDTDLHLVIWHRESTGERLRGGSSVGELLEDAPVKQLSLRMNV